MQLRMTVATVLLIALDLAAATSARAQSVADADNAMHAMELRMRALVTARKNLQHVESLRQDPEANAARDIADAETSVFSDAVKVFTVGFIVTGIKCPEDLRFTQQQFVLVVKSFVATADTEIARINQNLPAVAATAAHAEAVSIRDLIVDLRDLLKPFAT